MKLKGKNKINKEKISTSKLSFKIKLCGSYYDMIRLI